MRVVIIEDELPASEKLRMFIKQYDDRIEIVGELRSVKESLAWFAANRPPDLMFADIELLDGSVFGAFESGKITAPIIFTTAYDQFWLQAFERNGIAYLLKPFTYEKFVGAMQKFDSLKQTFARANQELWREVQLGLRKPKYRDRFAIKVKGGIRLLETRQIVFIKMRNEIPFAFDAAGDKYPLKETLTELSQLLDPAAFFRLNRSEIVNLDFIERLEPDFQDRLVLRLRNSRIRLVSSTNRTPDLRKWLENS